MYGCYQTIDVKGQPVGSVLRQHLRETGAELDFWNEGIKASCMQHIGPFSVRLLLRWKQKADSVKPHQEVVQAQTVGTLALAWEPGFVNELQRKSRLPWLRAVCSLKQQS